MAKITKFLYYKDGRPAQIAEDGSDSAEFAGDLQILGDLTVSGEVVAQNQSNVMLGDLFIDLNIDATSTDKPSGIAHVISTEQQKTCVSITDAGGSKFTVLTFDSNLAEAAATAKITADRLDATGQLTFQNFDGSLKTCANDSDKNVLEANINAIAGADFSATVNGNDVDVAYSIVGARANKYRIEIDGKDPIQFSTTGTGSGFATNDIVLINDVSGGDDEEIKGLYSVKSVTAGGGNQTAITLEHDSTSALMLKSPWIQTQVGDNVEKAQGEITFKVSAVEMSVIAISDGSAHYPQDSKGRLCQMSNLVYATIEDADHDWITGNSLQDAYDTGNEIVLTDARDLLVSKPLDPAHAAAISLEANAASSFSSHGSSLDLKAESDYDPATGSAVSAGRISVSPSAEGAFYGIRQFLELGSGNGGDNSPKADFLPFELGANLAVGDMVRLKAPTVSKVTLDLSGAFDGNAAGELAAGDQIQLKTNNQLHGNGSSVKTLDFEFVTNGTASNPAVNPALIEIKADRAATLQEIKTVLEAANLHTDCKPSMVDSDAANVAVAFSCTVVGDTLEIGVTGAGHRNDTQGAGNECTITIASGAGTNSIDQFFAGGLAASLQKADANNYEDCKGFIGFVMHADFTFGSSANPNNGDSVRVAGAGSMLDGVSGLTYEDVGLPIYLSAAAAGGITLTPPSGSGDVVWQVGVVIDKDKVSFMPQFIAELP